MTNAKSSLLKSFLTFLWLLAFYEIFTYFSNDAYLPALPYLGQDLNTSIHMVQLTLTAWFLGSGWMQLFVGPLCDRVGRKPVLLVGGIIFILSTIACAFTHDIQLLLILRFIEGSTVASMVVPGYATIHELFDQKDAVHALAIMSSITILAPAFGPLLGAIVVKYLNWRWIFVLLAAGAAICIFGLFFKMPETKKTNSEKIQYGQIFLQYKNILLNKRFMLFVLTIQCFFASMIAWLVVGPFLLVDHFHLSGLLFGIAQIFVFGAFIIGNRIVKKLIDKWSLQRIKRIAINLLLIGGIYVLFSSFLWPNVLLNTVIAMMLLAGATGMALPVLNRLAVESSEEPMGSRIAISSLFMGVSATVTSAIVSHAYHDTLFSFGLILFVLSVFPLVLQVLNRD